MRIIAVSLTKGGVGKSVTAINLAAGLTRLGRRVLLIDTDTQGQDAPMLGIQPQTGLADVLLKSRNPMEMITPARENLWLLSGGRALGGAKRIIARMDEGGERVLQNALKPIENQFDDVILDTSPGWDSLTVNVLFYAKEILAPVSLEILTLQALIEFNKNLADIRKYHPVLSFRFVLPTFLDGRVRKSAEILAQLRKHCPDQICEPIRYNVRISEAPGFGKHIFEFAPNSTGAEDYMALAKKVAGIQAG